MRSRGPLRITRAGAVPLVSAVLVIACMQAPAAARAQASEQVRYAVGPAEDVWVTAPDGAQVFARVWRPAQADGGAAPPARVPVVLTMTPYPWKDAYDGWRNRFVGQGYAYALGDVYGTGNSEGCLEIYGRNEVAATSAVIEKLGSAAWSTGRVGMIGTSYSGGHALFAAALGSAAARARLEAVVASSAPTGFHDFWGHDGVPGVSSATSWTGSSAGVGQIPPAALPERPDPQRTLARQVGACRAGNLAAAAEFERSGSFIPWLAERSARAGAHDVRAATLMFEGFNDLMAIGALKVVGFFDRIPKGTPAGLVLGQWGHAAHEQHLAEHERIVDAWFDRHLRGQGGGRGDSPRVQIQDSTGVWRAEDSWPDTGGPAGQLALSAGDGGNGRLGAAAPQGATSYREPATAAAPPGRATFSTGRLPGALHLSGLPVLDLWLQLEHDDAHVAVQLNAFGRDGEALVSRHNADVVVTGRSMILGYRSARHLEPIRNGEFRQAAERLPAVGRPIRVPVRFMLPLDVVVPAGGEVTIEVAGTNTMGTVFSSGPVPSAPSGASGDVRILHDCEHPSALRFLMPDPSPELLDVALSTPLLPLSPLADVGEIAAGLRDGDGLASRAVCGRDPVDPADVVERRGG